MRSRNKDNADIPNFIPRSSSFLTTYNIYKIFDTFELFANDGVPGETSRLYVSINARDPKKIRKALIHKLIDDEDFSFEKIESILSSIAAKTECAQTSRWLFDADISAEEMEEFTKDIQNYLSSDEFYTYPTKNGYGLIAAHGFDTRELFAKWAPKVELKRDGMELLDWKTKK